MPPTVQFILVLLTATACGSTAPTGPSVEFAFDAGAKLGGCAVGDVLPDRPGQEIVAVASDGRVFLVFDDDGVWRSEVVGQAGGELIQCAIGDLRRDRPGNEIVAVGMEVGGEDDGGAGAAVVFWSEGDGWSQEVVCVDGALLHGVCVADLDAAHAGDEALLVGFTNAAILLEHDEEDGFTTRAIADLPGAGKNAVGFDGGAAVACTDGSVVHVRAGDGGAFEATTLDLAPAGAARLGAADGTLVVAYDDGTLGLLVDGEREVIHREADKLRGAVLADLDPAVPGLEAATGGYSNTITVLVRHDGAWRPRVVHRDPARIHHVVAGDVTARGDGLELVACGYSGKVVVILDPGRDADD